MKAKRRDKSAGKIVIGKSPLAVKLQKILRANILARYDNQEYWNSDIIREFQEEHRISDDEIKLIMAEFT